LIASWPNGIKAQQGGEIRRTPGHVIDIVPTVLELAGAKPHADAPSAPGKSLVPLFSKDAGVEQPSLWWFHDGHKAVRMGKWKAVAPITEPWELYDLSTDRDESTDLAVTRKDKLDELVKEWQRLRIQFTEDATADLPPEVLKKAQANSNRPATIKKAQDDARPKRAQVLLNGESFLLNDRHAFVMKADDSLKSAESKPWIFYGATLKQYPDKAESWMHEKFLAAGVAIAGIDVGEAYGSPKAFAHFEALHQHMVSKGYSTKPALLGRSRGGLWVSSWALEHPERVAGIGGIYPVYDFTTYPKIDRAAPAYGLSAEELLQQADQLNPIRRAAELAKAKIPVHIIHGLDDTVVPIDANSGTLEKAYQEAGAGDLIEVVRIEGQGHNFWRGFFEHQPLVDFLIQAATSTATDRQ
jgi:predicted esterase